MIFLHNSTKFYIEYNSPNLEVIKLRRITKGEIVARKSYGKDIIFEVKHIIFTNQKKIAILKGVIDRIEADSDIEDLEIVDKKTLEEKLNKSKIQLDQKIGKKTEYKIGILTHNKRNQERIITGKILHLDGDNNFIYILNI